MDRLGDVVRKFGRLPKGMLETISSLGDNLLSKEAYVWLFELKKIVEQEKVDKEETLLRLISGKSELLIGACDGTKSLLDAESDTFNYINRELTERFPVKGKILATKKTLVEVYEPKEDGSLPQLFLSYSNDLCGLCLTEHQILRFVKKYRRWITPRDFQNTFILYEYEGDIFVAEIRFDNYARLELGCIRLVKCNAVWLSEARIRIVVPKKPNPA
jgi:hypothetical protein